MVRAEGFRSARLAGTLLVATVGVVTAGWPSIAHGAWPLFHIADGGQPWPLADGGFLMADRTESRIVRVAPDGHRVVVAGTGSRGFAGDGGPAVAAQLAGPGAVAVLAGGGLLVADTDNNRVRRIDADGVIVTVAGNGTGRHDGGDGGPAVRAALPVPFDLAPMADGGFVVASGGRVRRVTPGGVILPFAGTGFPTGPIGDGGPATRALVDAHAIAATADGGVLIGGARRVRRVVSDGTITTVAGGGRHAGLGDGGPAIEARLDSVVDVKALPDGGYLIADTIANRVRWVTATGVISTVIGPRAFRDFASRDEYIREPAPYPGTPMWVAALPDGYLIVNSEGSALYAPVGIPLRPAARITRSVVRRRELALSVASTQAGTVTVRLRATRLGTISAPQPVTPGTNRIAINLPRKPTISAVDVRLTSAVGGASDRLSLLLSRRLNERIARMVLDPTGNGGPFDLVAGRCRRMSARRVDCTNTERSLRPQGCVYIGSVLLGRDGLVRERPYRCRFRGRSGFRRWPHYTHEASVIQLR